MKHLSKRQQNNPQNNKNNMPPKTKHKTSNKQ